MQTLQLRLLFFAIIFLLNLIVIISMKRFQLQHGYLRDGKHMPETANDNILSKAQYRITLTFILVSLVLLVTNVPSHGIRFYIIVNQLMKSRDSILFHAQHVFQILYYFNFAVNFLLYSVSSRKFRKYLTFQSLCRCCKRRRHRQQTNEHLYRNYLLLPVRQTLQRRLILNDSSERNAFV